MKKLIQLLPLILITFLLTSCVDYVQSITYKDGKYQMYGKITLSKMLFAMAGEDPEKIFDKLVDEKIDNLPDRVEVNPVDTDFEVGAEFRFNVDPHTKIDTKKYFLPTVSGQKCYIPFWLGNEETSIADEMSSDDSEAQGMAEAFMSTAKCRVMISKKIIPSLCNAYFEGKGGQNYSIPIFDYGESYCLEIPFTILFENEKLKLDQIVVIKD